MRLINFIFIFLLALQSFNLLACNNIDKGTDSSDSVPSCHKVIHKKAPQGAHISTSKSNNPCPICVQGSCLSSQNGYETQEYVQKNITVKKVLSTNPIKTFNDVRIYNTKYQLLSSYPPPELPINKNWQAFTSVFLN